MRQPISRWKRREQSPWLVRGSWYGREVQRAAIDHWQHLGTSLRRTAEVLRSWLGRQERWQLWRPLDSVPPEAEQCHLGSSTVQRWLDRAGVAAQGTVAGQLAEVPTSGQVGTDGLWAKLRRGGKAVLLALTDSVSGVVWPPVVVAAEHEAGWKRLGERAFAAGLKREELRGVTSDGAVGLVGYLEQVLEWVNHQRCVWHLWRNLGGELARRVSEAATGLVGAAALAVRDKTRRELMALVRGVLDARSEVEAAAALAALRAHRLGAGLAQALAADLDGALVHLLPYNPGLVRVGPEWLWRDFRLRLSRGRNHGSSHRLERAALVWAIYRNFTPAQDRSERKRHYRRPGRSPLVQAGVPPGAVSYLDALGI
ncbi:MAG: transposase [Chloroflexi bacterium]|nr:transposase [Chloroflexota bacterium]